MNKKIIIAIAWLVIIAVGLFFYFYQNKNNNSLTGNEPQNKNFADSPQNATYTIEGAEIKLADGKSEIEIIPGSASKKITQYFGNEAKGDLNGDGTEDTVFLLVQNNGGSGTFFYVVAALKFSKGYVGTNAILLGDRVAPQTTEYRQGIITVNYAERYPNEPMTSQLSAGVSKYFKITDGQLVSAQVKMKEAEARIIAEKTCIKGGEALGEGVYDENLNTWSFNSNLNATKEGCTPACVVSEKTKTAEINWQCVLQVP